MKKRILVVDDSAFMRAYIKKALTSRGCQICGEAGDVVSAVSKYMQFMPDLVTMDLTMPYASGIDGVKALRSIDPAANIIMVSSIGQKQLIMEAIQAGAKDYIIKPFKVADLIQAVEKSLKIQGRSNNITSPAGAVHRLFPRPDGREAGNTHT